METKDIQSKSDIKLQDREASWVEIVAEKKFFAGSPLKYRLNQIKKFIPDTISEHVFHNNHLRPMLRFVINRYGDKEIVGCEVGVADGKHSFNMLYHLNTKKVYLIDPWINYDDFVDKDAGYEHDPETPNKEYQSCMKRISQFGDRAVIVRKMSHEAIADIKDKLDFVYLDANHKYKYVKRDIELYYPLLNNGGIFGGHDFSPKTPNVARAVLEFADREGLKIFGQKSDWWVIKK